MGAKNKVIAGDYNNHGVVLALGSVSLNWGFKEIVEINKDTVECYEVITEEKRKSASSAIMRGAAGAFILGPVGLLAGASAKNKGVYSVAIIFKDGNKSLLEVDERIYKGIIKALF